MKFQIAIVSMLSVITGFCMIMFAGNIYGHIPLIVGGLLYIAITAPLNNLKPEQGKTRKRVKNGIMSLLLLCTLSATAQTEQPVKEKQIQLMTNNESLQDAIENSVVFKVVNINILGKVNGKIVMQYYFKASDKVALIKHLIALGHREALAETVEIKNEIAKQRAKK